MRTLFFIFFLSIGCLLTGCNWIHKMDIEQGNVYTPEMVSKLHPGMTKAQVKDIMGIPTLLNTFNDNRVDYVYTNKPGGGKMTMKRVSLFFDKRGVLKNIEVVPEDNKNI